MRPTFPTSSFPLALALALACGMTAAAGEVRGRVSMPDVCSPAVSPAVVVLESKDAPKRDEPKGQAGDVKLVNQSGLQFVPRIQAISVGQTIRFTNQDSETHNLHLLTPGLSFNKSMGPGGIEDYTPAAPGLLKMGCDVHSHMRAFILVADSPNVAVCRAGGTFKIRDVAPGRYLAKVWHEMGDPLEREVVVADDGLDLGTLTLTAPANVSSGGKALKIPPRIWPEVIDRIGLLLGSSRAEGAKPGGAKKARRLAEDSYFVEFELSDMEVAVRANLGVDRAGELESQFRDLFKASRQLSEGKIDAARWTTLTRDLLINLVKASDDLNRMGITDGSKLGAGRALAADGPVSSVDRQTLRMALSRSLDNVRELADADEADDASSALTGAYFDAFEPIERFLIIRDPASVRPLELEFGRLRGDLGSGLKGEPLAAKLGSLKAEIDAALLRAEGEQVGSFAPAFFASLITILREGVEVILLLTMLTALATKAGRPDGLRAIWVGVGLAVVASLITAVALNMLIASAQGRTREVMEGLVLLSASMVLFYVSYWLIAQTQAKRWTDFIKAQASKSTSVGGLGALGLTAFLAVFREGAETALIFQAMIANQGGARPGLLGLAAGLAAGLFALIFIDRAIRKTAVRLPLRRFFQVTGVVLFAMSVVFAGHGVAELQQSGWIKQTAVEWAGRGIGWLGIYPNVQCLAIQGLLIAGALSAYVLMRLDPSAATAKSRAVKTPETKASKPSATKTPETATAESRGVRTPETETVGVKS
ncbi:FTR1 family protein [Isosphaeraceae bacterium EP7]